MKMKVIFQICELYALCLSRSILIPLLIHVMKGWTQNPDYSSPNCLMHLVNSTSPDHFSAHLFYKSVQFDADCDLDKYVSLQFSHDEFKVMNIFFLALVMSAAAVAVMDWRYILSWKFAATLFVGHHLCHLHHVFSHFGQDISFIVGNVMHHADTSAYVDGSNLSFVDTIPQGFAISVILSVVWACIVRAFIPLNDPQLSRQISWKSLFVANAIFGLVIAYQVKAWHPAFHDVAVESMENALPFTFNYMAYKHVYGHHRTGEWLGPHVVFDSIFNPLIQLYAYVHNDLLKLHIKSTLHYVFAIFFDSAISMLVVLLIWVMLRLQSASMDLIERLVCLKSPAAADISEVKEAKKYQ